METVSVLKLMPTSKRELDSFFSQTKNNILAGYTSPLEVAVMLKGMEDVIKKLRTDKEISDLILDEVAREGKETGYMGAKLTIKDVGVGYDYSVCGDSKREELVSKASELLSEIKDREKILLAHKEEWVDAETGEVIQPPLRTATEKVTVTLSK